MMGLVKVIIKSGICHYDLYWPIAIAIFWITEYGIMEYYLGV
jgi:hypothetical protein